MIIFMIEYTEIDFSDVFLGEILLRKLVPSVWKSENYILMLDYVGSQCVSLYILQ